MNPIFKRFVNTSLAIQGSVIIYELVHSLIVPVPSYLSLYDLRDVKTKHFRSLIHEIIRILLFFILVMIADIKHKEKTNKDDEIEQELQSDKVHNEELENLNHSVTYYNKVQEFCLIRLIIPNKALLAVYLYIIASSLREMNLVVWTIIPYIAYKILYTLYNRRKYVKIFIWGAISSVSLILYGILNEINKSKEEIVDRKVPEEAINYLKSAGYEVLIQVAPSNGYNLAVTNFFNTVFIFIIGDVWKILSNKEITAVLFHEIGHVVNRSVLFMMLVKRSLMIVFAIIEFIAIKRNKKLIALDEQTSRHRYLNNLILSYLLICISVSPCLLAVQNVFSNFDECEADKFAVFSGYRNSLISGLISLTVKNKQFYDTSFPFNVMVQSHYSLRRRISYIESIN